MTGLSSSRNRPTGVRGFSISRRCICVALCWMGSTFAYAADAADAPADVKAIRTAAEQGDADKQYTLGDMYYDGNGVTKDYAEAVKWFRKAADQGHADAQFNLGLLYYYGLGVGIDYAEAAKWYRKAADQGHADAQLSLGFMYGKGEGVLQDKAEGVRWWQKAAKQGHATALFNLGFAYGHGVGVLRDEAQGIRCWQMAADQGHKTALNNLGCAHARGQGVVQDDIEACSYWLTAAAFGSELGRNNAKRMAFGDRQWDGYKWVNYPPLLSKQEYTEAQRRAHERVAAIKKRQANANSNQGSQPVAATGEPQIASCGTGFIIAQDGHLLTCFHAVQDSRAIKVLLGGTTYPATIVKKDVANDLALLKIEGGGFVTIPIQTEAPAKGSKVFTVGFPNPDLQGTESKYTDGTISSLSGLQDDIRTMQISVPVQPGNSGGALVDEDGNVVGIVVAKMNAVAALGYTGDLPQNVNYAIKIMYAMPLIQSVEGLQKRVPPPAKSEKPTSVASTVEKATCMVMVYK